MAKSNIYTVDWYKLATWLVPPVLRKSKTLAFVKAMATPINDLQSRFLTYRNYTLYNLGITPQVCYLQKALNDRYDVDDRRIQVVDAGEKLPVPFFLKVENKPQRLYKKTEAQHLVLFQKAETAQFTADFVIRVPAIITFDKKEMTAFVNSYKLLSKTFNIITF